MPSVKKHKYSVTAELEEELTDRILKTSGSIPKWLSGTLVRNGPVTISINGVHNSHWFDGLSMLHAFAFDQGKVTYSNKFLRSEAYKEVFEKQSFHYKGFSCDPCRALFKKFFNLFIPDSHLGVRNANVNIGKIANTYVAITELPLPVKFDPHTLDVLGVLKYEDAGPIDSYWESAHPHYDFQDNQTYNYFIEFGWIKSHYNLYRMEAKSLARKVFSRIPTQHPSYMHSFGMTKSYIILAEFPLCLNAPSLMLQRRPFIKNFSWQPEKGMRFLVISKKTGEIITESLTEAFFAFHYANCFEDSQKIYCDLVTYKDASLVTEAMWYNNSISQTPSCLNSQLQRFCLNLATGKCTSEVLCSHPVEFPRFHPRLDGHPYRYVYTMTARKDAATKKAFVEGEGLYKIDSITKNIVSWEESRCCPGEPVFVPTPDGKEEDDGIILSIVMNKHQHDSFLLILDAKSFQEIGRAVVPHTIPAGLHGSYFDDSHSH